MTIRRGDTLTVLAETISRHGDGVGQVGEIEVHVQGLLPGETADVTVDYVSEQRPRAHGSVSKRRTDHSGRRTPPCPHHGHCTGCSLMEMELDSQRELKLRTLERRYGIKVDRMVGPEDDGWRYRWSSKRVVSGTPGHLFLGSYMRGSHHVADMDGCLVDHPAIVASARELRTIANQVGIEAYDELSEAGDLRYAWFKTNGEGDVLVTIITAEPFSRAAEELPHRLEIPVGVAWGVQSAPGNVIRGTTARPLRGRQSIEISVAGVTLDVGPLGFLQPNPSTAGLAYHDLAHVPAGGATRGRVALDLYAGAGTTTALLRQHFENVLPCEAYPESARRLGIRPELAEEFLARILSSPGPPAGSIDLVVANPPRGGLGATVCRQLNQLRAPRVHIMSCNPASLAEDLERLTSRDGGYRLLQTRAYDTLPQTPHIEVVAWLVGRS